MLKNLRVLVIIPAYNEQEMIVGVINNIPKSIEGVAQITVAVIDDGSTDDTVDQVKSKTDAIVISHNQNQGVGMAFRTGLDYALKSQADIMVNIDADGQFESADIPKLIEPLLADEADFVTASRFIEKGVTPANIPRIKLWGNKKIAGLISWLTKSKFYDVSCGFRAFNRESLLNLNLFCRFTYVHETFLDLSFKGLRIKEVPIKVKYFSERQSRIYRGPFYYALNTLKIISKTMRDYQPWKFFSGIGFLTLGLGLFFDFLMFSYFIYSGGSFTPYKYVGFTGIFLNTFGLAILILALVADMLFRIRMNQERILYFQKKEKYSDDQAVI